MSVSRKKTVVVTGASSGIGLATVARKVQAGWHVFASVRKAQDADRLRSNYGVSISPLLLDVADRASIQSAAESVSRELGEVGLDGLVNVAGIGKMDPVEYMSHESLREIFEINVFGQIAVTQAFLPLIRAARGRIVNISSVGAHIAIPFGSLINASKSAFGIFSDTLRLELHPFGVTVCVVEPGAIKTPAVDKTLGDVEAVIRSLSAEGAIQYGGMLRAFARQAYEREMNGSSPEVVAEAIHHALTSTRPRLRYRAGKHANLLPFLAAVLPERLLDKLRFRLVGTPGEFGAVK